MARMASDLKLAGKTERMVEACTGAVRRLVRRTGKPLGEIDEVTIPVCRVCLTTIYSCGLRLLEGATLEVPQIDSNRMQLHIHGKARRDRYVPLPEGALLMLRGFWRTHRAPILLFPAVTRKGRGARARRLISTRSGDAMGGDARHQLFRGEEVGARHPSRVLSRVGDQRSVEDTRT